MKSLIQQGFTVPELMTVVAIIGAMPPYGQASVQYTFNGSGSVQGPIGRFERTAA